MGRVTQWYYKGYFVELLIIDGLEKYKADIDGSLHNSLNSAKSHIDYLSK